MSKIRIEKDNVILSIEEEDLAQYEARGYKKIKSNQTKTDIKKAIKVDDKKTTKKDTK